MTISLYRRYRPRTFDEVTGQDMAVDILKKTLQRGQVGHAYLFSGPRGCGKTSLARLLAKALNCTHLRDGYEPCGECENCVSISSGDSLDVVEIDGASNNGVEEIRELKTHVSLSPFSSTWKVYIIDEVHMLSISAFNALLKTLEEPPAFVIFILATTEPFKVPVTIRSRCQHIPFHRISAPDIQSRLIAVAEKENVKWEEDAVREIARQADGALRDALSMMEQTLSLGNGEITVLAVDRLLGGGTMGDLEQWVASLKDGSVGPFLLLEEMFLKGASPQRVMEGIFLLFRNLWVLKRWGNSVLDSLSLSESEIRFLTKEEPRWVTGELAEMMLFCARLIPQVRAGLRADVLSGVLAAKIFELTENYLLSEEKKKNAPSMDRSPETSYYGAPKKRDVLNVSVVRSPFPKKDGPAPGPTDSLFSRTEKQYKPGENPLPSPENWAEFEKILFQKDLLLYCILVNSEITIEDRSISILFPKGNSYCFEVLSIERNSYSLASRVEEFFGEDTFVFLCRGDERRQCSTRSSGAEEEDRWNAEQPNIPLFRIPGRDSNCGTFSIPSAEVSKAEDNGEEKSASAVPLRGEREEDSIPFEGLVSEILKWGGGEVVLVKRGDQEGDIFDETIISGEN